MKRSLAVTAVVAAVVFGYCQASLAVVTGQYLFEEGSGTTALNTASNPLGDARNGTLTNGTATGGPTYTAGLYNGSNSALLFDKNQKDRVALPMNTDFIRNAPGATIMAWVKIAERLPITEPPENFFTTIVQVNNTDPTAFAGFGGARAAISNSLNQGFRSIGSKANEARNGLNSFNFPVIGVPVFAVGVFDYVNGTNTMFVNGVQVAQNIVPAWNGNSADEANLHASIGANPDPAAATTVAFHGAIDGVRIFNTALDATTILATYNAEVKLPVLGDYNGNGTVDAADYVLWRDGNIAADGTGPSETPDGIVDGLDYDFWKARFGNTTNPGSGSGSAISAVPEPTSCVLALLLAAMAWAGRRTRTVRQAF